MAERDQEKPYRILIAVGDEDQLTILLALALPLARARHGQIIPLYVGDADEIPDWLRLPVDTYDVVTEPQVKVSHDVGGTILAFARETEPDLLLVHWKGQAARGRYLLGPTLDPVIQYSPCDVGVVRVREPAADFARRMLSLKQVLVPYGGGPNASLALTLALDLDPQAQVTALRVAQQNLGPTAISAQWDMLRHAIEPHAATGRLRPKVALALRVVEGILQDAQDRDLVLIGASRESLVDRLLFGNLPQELALKMEQPLLIIRHHDPLAVAALRQARWRILSIMPQLTLEERIDIYRQVRRNARASTDYYALTLLATTIASLGLLLDSSAVIIGAMIIAPMMSALSGMALGIVQGDAWLLRLALRTALLGILLAIGVSLLLGFLMPGNVVTAEMASRSSPNLLDLAVALVSGAAAAYAMSRPQVSSVLPGVAIAVALVPPLATVGLAAAGGQSTVAMGALLLFLTNLTAIVAATSLVFLWVGFHPDANDRTHARTFKGGALGTAILLLLVTIVLGALSARSIRERVLWHNIDQALAEQVETLGPDVALARWAIAHHSPETLSLDVALEAAREVSADEVATMQERLALRLGRHVSLEVSVQLIRRFRSQSQHDSAHIAFHSALEIGLPTL
jgi:uncharacterized hydrophobic protein (TIGR00271 family)